MPLVNATLNADHFDGTYADYSFTSQALVLWMLLPVGRSNSAWANGDTFASTVTRFILTNQNDYFQGDGTHSYIRVDAGAGDDSIGGFAGGFLYLSNPTNYVSDMYGEAGDDSLYGGQGIDHFYGGEGRDTAGYRHAYARDSSNNYTGAGVTASLANPSINTGWAAGDTYDSIEDLEGTEYNDILYSINDVGGMHQLVGDPGTGDGVGGNDILVGGNNETTFIPGAGQDLLYGGGGLNLIDYETAAHGTNSNFGVTVDLTNPNNNTGEAYGDLYFHLQYVATLTVPGQSNTSGHNTDIAGSMFMDILRGDGGRNVILGDAGNDALYPVEREFNDAGVANPFRYANGSDVLYGEAGDDMLIGRAGADVLSGGSGADTFVYELVSDSRATMNVQDWSTVTTATVELPGYDLLVDFETGIDVIHLGDDSLRLRESDISVASITVQRVGNHGSWVYAGDLMIASLTEVNLRDIAGWTLTSSMTLLGSADGEVLVGSQLGDSIYGGGGSDSLRGGLGADVLSGGAGSDTFVYLQAGESSLANSDLITDFLAGDGDKIDLSGVHANASAATIGFSYQNGNTLIFINLDNAGDNEMCIQVLGNVNPGDVIW